MHSGIGHPRHATIQAIKHHGHEDCDGSKTKVFAGTHRITRRQRALGTHGVDDGIEAGKQVRRRKQIGQKIDATMPDLATFRIMPFFDMFIDR